MKELLKLWNSTAIPYPSEHHLSQLIYQTAQKFPHKTAVIYRDKSLTYTQVIDYSNQFAAYLIAKKIKVGDIIGLAAECSIEMLISLLGILKAGAVYVPLDPKYPKDRIEYMLSDSNARLLLVSNAYKDKFRFTATSLVIENIWDELKDYKAELPDISIKGTDLAYILYTSGSTGKPKGVKIMHHNLINLLTSMQSKPGITSEDRLLAITTISFDIAALELYLPLITGAELIISDMETSRDGRLLLDILEEKKITIMQATPSTWRMMLDSGWNKTYPLKVFCGGEPLPKDLADHILERSSELWNMYGPTETTIYSIIKQIKKDDPFITIGYPIQNTQIYIFDQEFDLAKPGTIGEIYIGGAGVAAGYLNQQELSDERFIPDPFSTATGAKLYKTGDLGKFLSNGDIQYHGRIDQQVKIRGHRIELSEIEIALTSLEGIKQAVVLAREDVPGEKRLVAYVLLPDHEAANFEVYPVEGKFISGNQLAVPKSITDAFKAALKLELPEYMVPNEVVVIKEFPLTPNYKIDKLALPKPRIRINELLNTEHLPQGENEQLLSVIWSAVLGIENIGIHDNFFEMGGHSILAVKVMSAIEKQTGKRLPLSVLFDNSTIEKLAKKISSGEEEKWTALVPIKTSGTKDPVYLIHGAGLNVILFKSITKYLDKDQPVYGLQAIGLNKPAVLPTTVEDIARIYINEIMEINPEGPYCLVGYSMGGFIAFEMAKQLHVMGKKIKLLGMMDTYAGNNDRSDPKFIKLSKKLFRQTKKLPFLIKSFSNYPKETLDYQFSMLKQKVTKKSAQTELPETIHFTPYELEIYNNYKIAQQHYTLSPIDIRISLFKVQKRLYFLEDLKYLGWAGFTKKGINVYEVPGDHRTFLYPPNDEKFAEILQLALDKVIYA